MEYMAKLTSKEKAKEMEKSKAKQINKNNKSVPKNLEKKQYDESLAELKKDIKDEP